MRKITELVLLRRFVLFVLLTVFVVNVAVANPVWTSYFPIEPVNTQPQIVFQSPQQSQTISSEKFWLNFTIIKPESWYVFTDEVSDQNGNPVYFNLVNITKEHIM